jgi:hypothetical protein
MDFNRAFPMTYWFWHRRKAATYFVLALFLLGIVLYKVPELLYLYKANRVLTSVVSSEPQWFAESPARELCPQVETGRDGTQTRICSKGDPLHPDLLVAVSQPQTHHAVDVEVLLPRKQVRPLLFSVYKDYDKQGDEATVDHRPSENHPRGVRVRLARDARPKLRFNYSCAIPFVTCTTFADFVTQN